MKNVLYRDNKVGKGDVFMKRIFSLVLGLILTAELTAIAPASAAGESTGTGGTGARSAAVNTDVFLGGKYIEVGLSATGSFGSAGDAPKTGSPYFHPWSGKRLGMVSNPTGNESDWNSATADYFLPAVIDEGFLIGWNGMLQARGSQIGTESDANMAIASGTATVNQSSGNTLKAATTGKTTNGMEYRQVVGFNANDKFFNTTVTLTNKSGTTLNGVRYMRRFDPDQKSGIINPTTNNVVGHSDLDDHGTSVIAYGANDKTTTPFIFFSSDSRATAGYVNNPTSLHFNNLFTESRMITSNGSALYADTDIFIRFDLGDMAPNQEVTFSYTSSLDTDITSSVERIIEETRNPDVNPDADPANHDDGHCIDYSQPDLIVPGSKEGFSINLTQETLTIPDDYEPSVFSIDGGEKWKPVKGILSPEKFPKLFNKDITLLLSDMPVERETKKPPKDAQIVKFPLINKRPKPPKLVVNYLIAANKTGSTPGEWVLTEKDGSVAVKEGIQIGVGDVSKKGKTVNELGFGHFYAGKTNGICVKPLTGAKTLKTMYIIRTAPKKSGGTYTAASKARRITATGEQKRIKVRVKSTPERKNRGGTVKTKASATLAVKAGTYVKMNGKVKLYTERAVIDVLNYEGIIELWTAAKEKKAAGAKQEIDRSA